MPSDYILEVREDFIHVKLCDDFQINSQVMLKIWAEMSEVCKNHDCRHVLMEGKISERVMNTFGAFESGSRVADISPGLNVAMCFYDYQTDDISEFFQTVAANRGTCIQFFTDIINAKKWLGIVESPKPSEAF